MIKVIEKVTTIEKFGKKIFHSKEKQPCLTNNFIWNTLKTNFQNGYIIGFYPHDMLLITVYKDNFYSVELIFIKFLNLYSSLFPLFVIYNISLSGPNLSNPFISNSDSNFFSTDKITL